MHYSFNNLRKFKQALEEAVRDADTAVQAAIPSPDEVERIKEAFDASMGKVAKMMEELGQDGSVH